MATYAVYLHLELLEVMPKRGVQQQRILRFIQSLSENPFAEGDYVDKDKTSRTRQIKIVGDYAITYWADHAAKTVIVVDIAIADR
jgi:mRNA-degrading endonuclease RelE of RelBE toxin-antitoxin system